MKKCKVFLGLFVCLLISAFCFTLVGCSGEQKREFVNKYGEGKAFSMTLEVSTVSYDISSLTGDYKEVAEYSISKADALSSKISIISDSSSSNKITTYSENDNINAYNSHSSYSSSIYYNTYNMKSYSKDGKKHIALDEMGHTFGLVDIYDSAVEPYSVMYGYYSNSSKYTFTDYQEFDIHNVRWKYGE